MRVLVIGAGASGLVTAKTLRERGHEVSVVESGRAIGGTFENKAYKDARMVSSKYLTCFSDFRAGPDAESHMMLCDYVVYLQEYAKHFGLVDIIRFDTKIEKIKQVKATGNYEVLVTPPDARHGHSEEWDAIAVCSGLHNVPSVPSFPGQESFTGDIFHSATYKDSEVFKGKDVLVVGSGETGFDVGYQAATVGANSVTLSTRHGFVSVPAMFSNRLPPLDCIIMNWATHGWESNWAMRVGLHWWITTKFNRMGFWLMTGSTYGFNQWAGRRFNMTWDEGRKHIVNKSTKCMPLISRKLKSQRPWWCRLPWWSMWDQPTADHATAKDVDLVEGSIVGMSDRTVTYETKEGKKDVKADIVVLATGYKQKFPFLFEDRQEDDPLPSEHFILNPDEPRLAYIGFIRPNVGAIPPMAELQAMWWCQRLEGRLVASSPDYYKLQGRRLCYGVDYGYYMFALAREMGAIPSLLHWLLRNPRVAVTCGFGQAHVPIFRLEGPFKDPKAEETCSRELLGPILQRPVFMNTVLFVEAIALGIINAATTAPGFAVLSAVSAISLYHRQRRLSLQ